MQRVLRDVIKEMVKCGINETVVLSESNSTILPHEGDWRIIALRPSKTYKDYNVYRNVRIIAEIWEDGMWIPLDIMQHQDILRSILILIISYPESTEACWQAFNDLAKGYYPEYLYNLHLKKWDGYLSFFGCNNDLHLALCVWQAYLAEQTINYTKTKYSTPITWLVGLMRQVLVEQTNASLEPKGELKQIYTEEIDGILLPLSLQEAQKRYIRFMQVEKCHTFSKFHEIDILPNAIRIYLPFDENGCWFSNKLSTTVSDINKRIREVLKTQHNLSINHNNILCLEYVTTEQKAKFFTATILYKNKQKSIKVYVSLDDNRK